MIGAGIAELWRNEGKGLRLRCNAGLVGSVSTIALAFAIASPAHSVIGCAVPGTNPTGTTCTTGSGESYTSLPAGQTFTNDGTVNNQWIFGIQGTLVNNGSINTIDYLQVGTAGTLTNAGTINLQSGLYGGHIFNNGLVDMLPGSSIVGVGNIYNYSTGVLNTATGMQLGGLYNSGKVVINGGRGALSANTLTGSFIQDSTGSLHVRADWTGNGGAGAADKLAISGTAVLAGTVVVTPMNFPTAGGSKTFTVLTAGGGITNSGITIANTAAVNYALLFPDANTMNVQATINFQGVGLNNLTPNQNSVGGNLNRVYGGGGNLGFMPTLMQLPSGGQLGQALNQLAPIGDGGSFSTAMNTGGQFAQHLLSCRMAGEEGDVNRFIKEGQCVWARVNARKFDNDGRADGVGYKENALFYSAGAQLAVARDWRIGGGIGYETLSQSTDAGSSSTGDRVHLGGVVKYTPGAWMFAAGVTGGFGWHDNRRNVSFGGFGATATSSSDTSFVASRLTAAYLMSRGMFYAKPQVEFAATHLQRDGYTETGTGGIALRVAKHDDTVLSVSPSLELGAESRGAGGFVTRGFIKGGATFRDTDTFVTTATFADAVGAPSFAITSRVDKTVADVGAGLDLISAGGTALRLQYDGQLGQHTMQHVGGAKLSIKF